MTKYLTNQDYDNEIQNKNPKTISIFVFLNLTFNKKCS